MKPLVLRPSAGSSHFWSLILLVVGGSLFLPRVDLAVCIDYTQGPGHLVAEVETPAGSQSLTVSGTLVYLPVYGDGLQIYDVSEPAAPVLVGSIDTPGRACEVAVLGGLAYVADGDSGLQVVDVSDPASPVIIGSVLTRFADGLAVADGFCYLGDGLERLKVIDVSDPSSPQVVAHLDWQTGWARHVALGGGYAYITDGMSLRVVDISNPLSPRLAATLAEPGGLYAEVVLSGDILYMAGGEQSNASGLLVIDVSDPTQPTILSRVPGNEWVFGVAVSGNYAYLASSSDGMRVIDISDPLSPRVLGGVETGGALYGAAVANECVYLANSWGLLQVAPTHCPGGPTPCQIALMATSLSRGIKITWTIPRDIAVMSVQVYRKLADAGEEGWECISPILPVEEREGSYVDMSAEPTVAYAYVIEVVGSDGVAARFGPALAKGGRVPLGWCVAPNPVHDRLRLYVDLPVAGDISVSIVDAAGREVSRRSFGSVGSGSRSWDWRPVDRWGRDLAVGTYWIRLHTPGGTTDKRWVLVR